MSSISIRWERRAVKELRSLPKKGRRRVYRAVDALALDPMRGKPLSGEWRGLRRLRVGGYRVIYGFDGREVLVSVVRVARRNEAYR